MLRGSKKTFASDPTALNLAVVVREKELERGYSVDQQAFCYLPFDVAKRLKTNIKVLLVSSVGGRKLSWLCEGTSRVYREV